MTDAEKLSTCTIAAQYQAQLDGFTRQRDDYKNAVATLDQQIQAKTKQLDDLWKSFRTQVGSGS